MNEGDNPPIGIVLCADKSESVVKPEFNTLKYKKTNKKCWKILNFSAFFY
jgi:hypothetical protein